ncbi:hypothetical protein OROHE_022656 [Orobanche hederae]
MSNGRRKLEAVDDTPGLAILVGLLAGRSLPVWAAQITGPTEVSCGTHRSSDEIPAKRREEDDGADGGSLRMVRVPSEMSCKSQRRRVSVSGDGRSRRPEMDVSAAARLTYGEVQLSSKVQAGRSFGSPERCPSLEFFGGRMGLDRHRRSYRGPVVMCSV